MPKVYFYALGSKTVAGRAAGKMATSVSWTR